MLRFENSYLPAKVFEVLGARLGATSFMWCEEVAAEREWGGVEEDQNQSALLFLS